MPSTIQSCAGHGTKGSTGLMDAASKAGGFEETGAASQIAATKKAKRKRSMNPSFVFGGTAGYWVHERNKQFEQSRGAQSILA